MKRELPSLKLSRTGQWHRLSHLILADNNRRKSARSTEHTYVQRLNLYCDMC